MSKAVAGAGAVIALTAVLAMGAVAYGAEETHPGHQSELVEGLYRIDVMFEYPDGHQENRAAWAYFGTASSIKERFDELVPYTVLNYPDPPEGYLWDHPPDYVYTEDTTVRAIPTA